MSADLIGFLVRIHFATWATVAVSGGAAFVALFKFGRLAVRSMRRMSHFLDQWLGDEDRPGVLGRLDKIEAQQYAGAEKLEAIDHELHPNSGGSMFDKLTAGQVALSEQITGNAGIVAAHIAATSLAETAHAAAMALSETARVAAAALTETARTTAPVTTTTTTRTTPTTEGNTE